MSFSPMSLRPLETFAHRRLWEYVTTDALEDLMQTDYWRMAAGQVEVGDVIWAFRVVEDITLEATDLVVAGYRRFPTRMPEITVLPFRTLKPPAHVASRLRAVNG